MRRREGRCLAGLVACLLTTPWCHTAAQDPPARPPAIRLGLTRHVLTFGAATEPLHAIVDPTEAMPWRPTLTGLAFHLGSGRLRAEAAIAYGSAGLAVRGLPAEPGEAAPNLTLVAHNAFHLGVASLGLSRRLVRFSRGPALWPSLGAAVERWTSPGAPARLLAVLRGGLRLEIPLSRRFDLGFEGAIGYSGASPIDPESLPEGYRTRSTWRRSLALELGLKL